MLKASLSISSVATELPSLLISFSMVLAEDMRRRISGHRVLGLINLSRLAALCAFPNLEIQIHINQSFNIRIINYLI